MAQFISPLISSFCFWVFGGFLCEWFAWKVYSWQRVEQNIGRTLCESSKSKGVKLPKNPKKEGLRLLLGRFGGLVGNLWMALRISSLSQTLPAGTFCSN